MQNRQRLAALANCHQGEACVIIATGPSLTTMDLSPLRTLPTIGLNRLYLHFETMGFVPTYYVVSNELVLDQCWADIEDLGSTRFVNWNRRKLLGERASPPGLHFLLVDYRPRFSRDITRGVWGGGTVTFAALQVAYYLGFTTVILVGVDHAYSAIGTPHHPVVSTGEDRSHFRADYFGPGFRWQLPDLRMSETAYRMARQAYESDHRQVLDATQGGKLDVFPKVDYREIVDRLSAPNLKHGSS